MGNYVIAVGNYVIVSPSELGNYVSADSRSALPDVQPGDGPADEHPLDFRRALENGEDTSGQGSFRRSEP
jgi:hypothetical protein